jgi:hypothetical protein
MLTRLACTTAFQPGDATPISSTDRGVSPKISHNGHKEELSPPRRLEVHEIPAIVDDDWTRHVAGKWPETALSGRNAGEHSKQRKKEYLVPHTTSSDFHL